MSEFSDKVQGKPWPCTNCGHNIGNILYSELKVDGISANTDGPNLVLKCPECGTYKTWYGKDRMSRLIDELAKAVSSRQLNG